MAPTRKETTATNSSMTAAEITRMARTSLIQGALISFAGAMHTSLRPFERVEKDIWRLSPPAVYWISSSPLSFSLNMSAWTLRPSSSSSLPMGRSGW